MARKIYYLADKAAEYANAMYGESHDTLDIESALTVEAQMEHDIKRGATYYGASPNVEAINERLARLTSVLLEIIERNSGSMAEWETDDYDAMHAIHHEFLGLHAAAKRLAGA